MISRYFPAIEASSVAMSPLKTFCWPSISCFNSFLSTSSLLSIVFLRRYWPLISSPWPVCLSQLVVSSLPIHSARSAEVLGFASLVMGVPTFSGHILLSTNLISKMSYFRTEFKPLTGLWSKVSHILYYNYPGVPHFTPFAL